MEEICWRMIKSIFEVDVVVDLDIRNGLQSRRGHHFSDAIYRGNVVCDGLYVLLLLLMMLTHTAVTSTQYKVY